MGGKSFRRLGGKAIWVGVQGVFDSIADCVFFSPPDIAQFQTSSAGVASSGSFVSVLAILAAFCVSALIWVLSRIPAVGERA